MTDPEKLFQQIIADLPNATEGKMFGAKSIMSANGKTAAFFWKEDMTFKLDKKSALAALKIDGAKIGSHIYATEKQMNGWVLIPRERAERWIEFSKKALDYVEKLKK